MIATETKTIGSDKVKVNFYAKACYNCRNRVEEKEGYAFQSSPGGSWLTSCKQCYPYQIVKPQRILNSRFEIHTPYEPENLPIVRSFPGAKWNPAVKCWSVSSDMPDRPRVIELATRLGLSICPSVTQPANETQQEFEIKVPAGKTLFPYQIEGIKFLAGRDRALIGDEPGLGKTAQSILALPNNPRVLVVCPSCVKGNWRNEFAMWKPDVKVTILKGKNSLDRVPEENECLIVNYDILPSEVPAGWESAGVTIIADECHMVKNYKAARSKKLVALTKISKRVWFLSGTPLLNRPFDLLGVLQGCQLDKKTFGGWMGFLKAFNGYETRWGGYEFGGPEPYVAEKMRNVMLRRLKKDVLKDLPPIIRQDIPVNDLSASLRREMDDLWENSEISLLDADDDLPKFEEFSRVRSLIAEAKILHLIELIEQYEESEVPVLVFSAHRKPALEIGSREGWASITGDNTSEERTEIVRKFQAGELKGVSLTIQAGGVGLTLTLASTVIMNDLDWTPALNEQAIARVHRIGQSAETINVINLVADHPLDRHIHMLLTAKMEMQRIALDGESLEATIPEHQEGESQSDYEARCEAAKANRKETPVVKTESVAPKSKEVKAAEKVGEWIANMPERESFVLTDEIREQVRGAFSFLCSVCDGAETQDGHGFNKMDVCRAEWINIVGLQQDEVVQFCWHMVKKYKKQIGKRYPLLFAK